MATRKHAFRPEEVEFLTHHAQEMYGPDDFDNEVQEHLNAMNDEPEDEAQSEEKDNKSAIRNISFGSGPKVPGSPKPPTAPPESSNA